MKQTNQQRISKLEGHRSNRRTATIIYDANSDWEKDVAMVDADFIIALPDNGRDDFAYNNSAGNCFIRYF